MERLKLDDPIRPLMLLIGVVVLQFVIALVVAITRFGSSRTPTSWPSRPR